MLAQLSLLILAGTLGQAPPETAWLNAVPGDVDVVIRCRGLDATRDDLENMLKAMSPEAGREGRSRAWRTSWLNSRRGTAKPPPGRRGSA